MQYKGVFTRTNHSCHICCCCDCESSPPSSNSTNHHDHNHQHVSFQSASLLQGQQTETTKFKKHPPTTGRCLGVVQCIVICWFILIISSCHCYPAAISTSSATTIPNTSKPVIVLLPADNNVDDDWSNKPLPVWLSSSIGNVSKARRNVLDVNGKQLLPSSPTTQKTSTIDNRSRILGFRLEGNSRNIIENEERYVIKAEQEVSIRLFVQNIQSNFMIGFSSVSQTKAEQSCRVEQEFQAEYLGNNSALAKINLAANVRPYHLCFSDNQTEQNVDDFFYAGSNDWFQIKSEAPMMPMWLHISLLMLLLTMSGLFSGLNLGLMALDKNELQVIERCGTEDEKYYAKTISPVRKRGNYLLCTLLLGNVLVNSTLTILLDDLTSGIFAVIGSTLSIVIFGEIIPQALCSRHGLAVGAKTVYITYLFMLLTFPLSYPISKLLDKILGEEIGSVYDRERLMEYIRVTKDYNNLEADEMNIISGALKFKKISVADVMTPISDVFMLPYDAILNFDTLTRINNSGYSRIPVYEHNRDNVVGLLHVKDLSLIDPDHNLPLKVVLDFYSHPLVAVYEDVKLDKMLNEFKQGKSHMALIRRVIDNGINDPYFELLGVVTLEDIIEELIQAEINDETDVISDNRRKQKRQDVQSRSNYLEFIRTGFQQHLKNPNTNSNTSMDVIDFDSNSVVISPQLALAAFRFLASSVGPFNSDQISEEVLKILMAKNIYFEAKGEARRPNIDDMSEKNVLYKRGVPADYFIMILEGRARVIVTKENQEYDAGPFCCFGIGALTTTNAPVIANTTDDQQQLTQNRSFNDDTADSVSQRSSQQNISQQHNSDSSSVFIPDYTLICLEKVIYMRVSKNFHQMALNQTNLERKRQSVAKGNEDKDLSDSEQNFGKLNNLTSLKQNIKSLPPKYRKISMATNLPDSSLMQDFNFMDDDEFDHQQQIPRKPHLIKSLTVDPPKPAPRNNDNFKRLQNEMNLMNKRKSSPVELALKRSDAIELLTGNGSPRSYGSIESLQQESNIGASAQQNTDTAATNNKIKLNGSLNALDSKSNTSQHNATDHETSTLI